MGSLGVLGNFGQFESTDPKSPFFTKRRDILIVIELYMTLEQHRGKHTLTLIRHRVL